MVVRGSMGCWAMVFRHHHRASTSVLAVKRRELLLPGLWGWSVAKPVVGLVFSQGLVQVIRTILRGGFCDQSEILRE